MNFCLMLLFKYKGFLKGCLIFFILFLIWMQFIHSDS